MIPPIHFPMTKGLREIRRRINGFKSGFFIGASKIIADFISVIIFS